MSCSHACVGARASCNVCRPQGVHCVWGGDKNGRGYMQPWVPGPEATVAPLENKRSAAGKVHSLWFRYRRLVKEASPLHVVSHSPTPGSCLCLTPHANDQEKGHVKGTGSDFPPLCPPCLPTQPLATVWPVARWELPSNRGRLNRLEQHPRLSQLPQAERRGGAEWSRTDSEWEWS